MSPLWTGKRTLALRSNSGARGQQIQRDETSWLWQKCWRRSRIDSEAVEWDFFDQADNARLHARLDALEASTCRVDLPVGLTVEGTTQMKLHASVVVLEDEAESECFKPSFEPNVLFTCTNFRPSDCTSWNRAAQRYEARGGDPPLVFIYWQRVPVSCRITSDSIENNGKGVLRPRPCRCLFLRSKNEVASEELAKMIKKAWQIS